MSGQTCVFIGYFLLFIVIRIFHNLCHVCAYNSTECFFKIKEDFHHKGDVDIGVFFPIHTYFTGDKVSHSHVLSYFNKFYLR